MCIVPEVGCTNTPLCLWGRVSLVYRSNVQKHKLIVMNSQKQFEIGIFSPRSDIN